jgi:hypothetical protein
MLKNLEIAQDDPDAEVVQCWGRSDRSGSSSALFSPLSLISSLQLDELELELELEDELEDVSRGTSTSTWMERWNPSFFSGCS